MNDEASSSAIAYNAYSQDEDERIQPTPTAAELAERRKKNRQMFNRKRGELLDDLLRNMDILVYAELSTVYYMEYARPNTTLCSSSWNFRLTYTVAALSSASS